MPYIRLICAVTISKKLARYPRPRTVAQKLCLAALRSKTQAAKTTQQGTKRAFNDSFPSLVYRVKCLFDFFQKDYQQCQNCCGKDEQSKHALNTIESLHAHVRLK